MTAREDAVDVTGSIVTGTVVAAAGITIGGLMAAGSVTVLSSQALGSAALSLGLASAPFWPVVAGGAAGLAIGYTAWQTAKHLSRNGPRS